MKGRRRTTLAFPAVLLLAVLALVAPVAASAGGDSAEPRAESGSSDWRQVVAGFSHSCGIRTTGRLYCWGNDDSGQLGDGAALMDQSTPVQVAGNATNWTAVSLGRFHTCARRATGRLYCWGRDAEGEVGNGLAVPAQGVPVEVAGGATNWSTVSAGHFHTCARTTARRLFCWGHDAFGQVGDGGTDLAEYTPVEVAGNATDWTSVTAGRYHTCGRRSTGRLYCWGLDASGLLGNGGPDTEQYTPVEVAGGLTTWTSVNAGEYHTCARRSTGRLYCWGNDDFGRLGNGGGIDNQSSPVEVAGSATNWAGVDIGVDHTCARTTARRLYCWGRDTNGQLGDSGTNTDQGVPVQVTGGATDWTSVNAGGDHTCARITSGRVYCWGRDTDGELGDGGANADRIEPTPVRA